MRHCRGHLTHDAEPRGMQKLGLKVLNAAFCLLPLGEIPPNTGEIAVAGKGELPDLQFHRKGLAVLAAPRHDAPDADDPPLAGPQVALDIAVMHLTVGCRHKNTDVAADHLG